MRKLSKLILTSALCLGMLETNALTPDIKVNVFGGYAFNRVKLNDPFITKENKDWYVENEPGEGVVMKSSDNSGKKHTDSNFKHFFHLKHDNSEDNTNAKPLAANAKVTDSKKQDNTKDDKNLGTYSGYGVNFGGSVEAEIVKDDYFMGLSLGMMYDTTHPTFQSTIHRPSYKEQIAQKEKEADKASGDEKKGLDADIAKLKEDKDKKENKGKQDHGKSILNTITVNSGITWFFGPYVGTYVGDDWSVALGCNIAMKKSSATVISGNAESGKSTPDFDMNFGIMPTLKISYYLNDTVTVFVSASYIKYFDVKLDPAKMPVVALGQTGPSKDAPKPKSSEIEKERQTSADFHGVNDSYIAFNAGVSVLVNN